MSAIVKVAKEIVVHEDSLETSVTDTVTVLFVMGGNVFLVFLQGPERRSRRDSSSEDEGWPSARYEPAVGATLMIINNTHVQQLVLNVQGQVCVSSSQRTTRHTF